MAFFSPWQGIGSFWWGICTFWREFVCFGKTRQAPARKFFDFFLANPARKNLKFSSPGCSSPHISPPQRGLVSTEIEWKTAWWPLVLQAWVWISMLPRVMWSVLNLFPSPHWQSLSQVEELQVATTWRDETISLALSYASKLLMAEVLPVSFLFDSVEHRLF